MPISTEERNGLVIIRWTTEIEKSCPSNGNIIENFQLNRFLKYVYNFQVSCTYSEMICREKERTFLMELSLKQIRGFKDKSSCPDEGREAIPNYFLVPRQVCCLCVVNNQLSKLPLKNSPPSDDWKSAKFLVQLTSPIVTCQLLIKFHGLGVIEMNVLKQTIDNLFLQQTNCDVRFFFEDGQHIGGHVSILSARSPVFAAMFNHDMQKNKSGIVFVRDIQRNIFFHMLHYIYSGRLILTSLMTVGTAKSIFMAADKYDIKDLKKECASLMVLGVSVKTAINLMIWGHLHSIDKIKQAALDVVVRNAKKMCLTDEWEWLTKNYPDLCIIATRRIMEIAQFP